MILISLFFTAKSFACGGGGGGGATSAPCTNTSSYGSLVAPTVPGAQTISTCNWQSEYNTITGVVAGNSYTIGSSCGGYVTVRRGTYNGTALGHGNAPYTFTAPTSGTYYIHYNTNSSCGTASTCCTTTITCNSCSAPYNPCSSIPNLTCGNQSGNVTASGSGAWDSYGGPYGVPGQEKLFTFTPTITGAHQLEVLGFSGSWVDFSYKAASGGCNSSGWTYIDDVNGTGLVFPTVNLTAGVQYYFMWDPEGTGSYSVNFLFQKETVISIIKLMKIVTLKNILRFNL